jgi:hypothetical protein
MEWLTTILGWINPLEWIKVFLERRKSLKKLAIYNALEQTGPTPPSLTIAQISVITGLCLEQVNSLLYEMIESGTIQEGACTAPVNFGQRLSRF